MVSPTTELNQGVHDEDQDDDSEYEQEDDDDGISINTKPWTIEFSFIKAYRELKSNGFSQVTNVPPFVERGILMVIDFQREFIILTETLNELDLQMTAKVDLGTGNLCKDKWLEWKERHTETKLI